MGKDGVRVPPNNQAAEEALLGAMMLSGAARTAGMGWVNAGDFYKPNHGIIFTAIATLHDHGQAIDLVTVASELDRVGYLDAIGGPQALLSLQSRTPATTNASRYGSIIQECSAARRLILECTEATDRAYEGIEADVIANELQGAIAELMSASPLEVPDGLSTIDEFLDRPGESRPPWVVPGMLRIGWRVLLVATEGIGKTVLFRHIAIAAAQGVHPMLHTPIPPVRALIVDLENPDETIHDVCEPIRDEAVKVAKDYDPERAWLWHRPAGINLRSRSGRTQLEAVIAATQPDLVCIGPLYKCYTVSARESDEQAAAEVEHMFDDLRTRYSFALMIEHHAPKKQGGSRDLAPYGSSLWLRWPELGLTLTPTDGDVTNLTVGRFRGDRVLASWPTSLLRSKPWPWEGKYPPGIYHETGNVRPPPETEPEPPRYEPRYEPEFDDF